MSLAIVRKSLLHNVPNIPRFGVTILSTNHDHRKKVFDTHIEFEGQKYRVAMFYAVHTECGKRIRALLPRATYQAMHSNEDRREVQPTLIFCPQCGALAGKRLRKQLLTQGKLYCFHNPDDRFNKEFVSAYYILPRGVDYNGDGEISSVNREWARLIDDEEVEADDAPEYNGN